MVAKTRDTFIRKWWTRGHQESDPFDRFFYCWIAAVVAANRYPMWGDSDTDRERFLSYLREHEPEVLDVLRTQSDLMTKLARRRGTRHGNPIVDTGSAELRAMFGRLSMHYTGRGGMSDSDLVEAVGELLNKIRHTLFHGGKLYDDREDIDLLGLVNPILDQIVRDSERFDG